MARVLLLRSSAISAVPYHPREAHPPNSICRRPYAKHYLRDELATGNVDLRSLLPGSAATVNPAFTIAANAERIMETLVTML